MIHNVIKAVILCGGQGTRIRGVADDLPKPMIPIGNMPILWHIMRLYSAHDVDEFVLCFGHKGSVIKDYFWNLLHQVCSGIVLQSVQMSVTSQCCEQAGRVYNHHPF